MFSTVNTIEYHPTKGCRINSCIDDRSTWAFRDDKALNGFDIYKLTGGY